MKRISDKEAGKAPPTDASRRRISLMRRSNATREELQEAFVAQPNNDRCSIETARS